VIITGGEPLSAQNWFKIVKLFSKNFKTEMFSNGTLISKSIAKKLKTAGVSAIKISIDGAKPSTHDYLRGVPGSFDKAIHGLKNILSVKIPVMWQATISKTNINELDEMIGLAESLGVDSFKASPLRNIGRAKETDQVLSVKEELYLTKFLELNKQRKITIKLGESFWR